MAEIAPEADIPADAPIDVGAYIRTDRAGIASLNLAVENLHCGGCVRRIEDALAAKDAVTSARVNLTTRRLALQWRADQARAGELLGAVSALGYRLVPFDPELLRDGAAHEDQVLLRAMAVAGFAAANVMLLSVAVWAGEASGDMGPALRDLLHWISALVALPAVAYAGRPFFRSAWGALRLGVMNMDLPISLAVLLAAATSLHETINHGQHTYFDASVGLLFFLLIGRYLDRRARSKARSAAEQLLLLGAVAARVVGADGQVRALPIGAVNAGMTVRVAPGDRVPVDGCVSFGQGAVDASLISGESEPRSVKIGDWVHAGIMNLSHPLEVKVAAAGDDTLLAEIVRLTAAAEQGKAAYVRLADRAARIYAPAVHLLALAGFLGWWGLGGLDWQPALLIAVAVLIITCPCALGLAVPVVQVVASGLAMRQGILVKAGDGFERLAEVDTLVFDKTGTLTHGRPELVNGADIAAPVLARAASLAAGSRHPLCQALVRAAGPVVARSEAYEHPGMGMALGALRLGNRVWCGVDAASPGDGNSELWFHQPGQAKVRLAFRDQLKADAAAVIEKLQNAGWRIEIVSGDRPEVVAPLARQLKISQWRADCRPDEKVAHLRNLAQSGRKVAMIGDGVNDAPALAAAYASLSPARAADVAQAAADFVFQGEDLAPVAMALILARRVRRLILQNFSLALAYNVLAVPLALAGLVTPLFAAIAMSSSSLLVTLNALRLNGRGAQ
ncbi:MAG: heavy metal translocating P-type ATPase [Proteobacteria bacterium]|nr:heavy metal translocating P-type ATPase [Pseudomonadota bacterium]